MSVEPGHSRQALLEGASVLERAISSEQISEELGQLTARTGTSNDEASLMALYGDRQNLKLMYGKDEDLAIVPEWAVNQDALRLCGAPQFGAFVVGPAVHMSYKAAFVTGLMWAFTPLAAYLSASCKSNGNAIADVPWWCYVIAALPIVCTMWLEREITRYALIPQLIRARELNQCFTFFGCVNMSFGSWLWVARLQSVVAHLDILTSGIFVGKAIATDYCGGCVSSAWHKSMKTSPTLFWLGELPFSVVALFGWLLISSQMVYALLMSPKCAYSIYRTLNPDEPVEEHFDIVRNVEDPKMMSFDTPIGHRLNLWNTIQALAELNRMVTTTQHSRLYIEGMAKSSPAILVTYLGPEAARRVLSLLVFQFNEGAFQINLQVAGLGLVKYVSSDDENDLGTMISIAFGIIVIFVSWCGRAQYMYSIFRITQVNSIEELASNRQVWPDSITAKMKIEENFEQVRRHCVIFFCISGMLLIFVLRVLLQIYYTVVVCPHGLHNAFQGCVPQRS